MKPETKEVADALIKTVVDMRADLAKRIEETAKSIPEPPKPVDLGEFSKAFEDALNG